MRSFRVFPDDWLAGTNELTAEETGAYWNLICHFMAKDGVVPDDVDLLARIFKLSKQGTKRVRQRLIEGAFIETREGMIWQRKAAERLEKDGKFSKFQREKIQKRWAAKKAKALENHDTADTPVSTPEDTIPYPTKTDTSYQSAGALAEGVGEGEKMLFDLPSAPAASPNARAPVSASSDGVWGTGEGGCVWALVQLPEISEGKARRLIGGWRKEFRGHGEDAADRAIVDVVLACRREFQQGQVVDPVPWIVAGIKRRLGPAPGSRPIYDARVL